ncbi:hypothetical protein B0H13DRAFT_2574406 [Mycena leptocephala]|nr:hypothetical protein B0H13DRAFT_2574406 [Mycena leptocephala]
MLIHKRRRSWLLRRSITSGVVSTDLGTPLRIFRLSIPALTLLVEPLTRSSTSRIVGKPVSTHTPRARVLLVHPRVVHNRASLRLQVRRPPRASSPQSAGIPCSARFGLRYLCAKEEGARLLATACFRFARPFPLLDGSDSAYGHGYRYPCAALVLGDLLLRTRSFLGIHSPRSIRTLRQWVCGSSFIFAGGARGPSLVEEMSLSLSPIYDHHPTSSTPFRMYLARPRRREGEHLGGLEGEGRAHAARGRQGARSGVRVGVVPYRGVVYAGHIGVEGEGDAERSYCADVLRCSEEEGRAASMESGHRPRYRPWGREWAGDWRVVNYVRAGCARGWTGGEDGERTQTTLSPVGRGVAGDWRVVNYVHAGRARGWRGATVGEAPYCRRSLAPPPHLHAWCRPQRKRIAIEIALPAQRRV